MRKIQILVVLILALAACEDREPQPITTPVWLESRIAELESSECPGCNIQRYTYNEEYYYHVYCNFWSCSDCEIYNYNGAEVDWEIIDKADFMQNKQRPILIWECKIE